MHCHDLMRKAKKGVILHGCTSDPYNEMEKEYLLTRHSLELINALGFGICFITKSDLVTRDSDILEDIKTQAPVSVNFSITCSEDELSKKIEPYAATATERFKAIAYLASKGLMTGVLIDPILPYITDKEENIIEIVKKAKYYGASYMYCSSLVTMADVQRDYFYQEVEKLWPGLSKKFKERFKTYYRCYSPKGKKLWHTFVEACEKEGMRYDMRYANQMIRRDYPEFRLI